MDENSTHISIVNTTTHSLMGGFPLKGIAESARGDEQEVKSYDNEFDNSLIYASDEDSESNDSFSNFSAKSRRSSVSSIARSISPIYRLYHFENERQYLYYREHCLLPSDDIERDRIDINHQMIFIMLGGELHLSPIENPLRVLDVGTGTGVWAIDMASKFPNARVVGTDVYPIQADSDLANCEFQVGDTEADWPFPTNYFDFIHARNMIAKIEDWPAFFECAFRHTRPGGWIELEGSDALLQRDGTGPINNIALCKLMESFRAGMAMLGRPHDKIYEFPTYLELAGFVDIRVSTYRLPVGAWSADPTEKLAGRYNILNLLEGMDGHCLPLLTRVLNMSMREARELVKAAEIDVQNRNKQHRLYFIFTVTRARKPNITSAVKATELTDF